MFIGRNAHRRGLRNHQGENVLEVVRHARRIAETPLGKNLESVARLPSPESIGRRNDSRLFRHFTLRRLLQTGLPADKADLPLKF